MGTIIKNAIKVLLAKRRFADKTRPNVMKPWAEGFIGKLDTLNGFVNAKLTEAVKAPQAGYVKTIRALPIGLATMKLGGGRATKDDKIDPNVGVVLAKKIGAKVKKGEVLATIYADAPITDDIRKSVLDAFEIVKDAVGIPPIILGTIR